MATLQEIIKQDLEPNGYNPGTPYAGPNALIDGIAIDKSVAEEIPCPECGGKCEYRPFVILNHETHKHDSYRAFAVCTQCGEAYEF